MATSSQLGTFSYDMILNYAKFEDALTKAQRLAEKQTNAITGALNKSATAVKDGLTDIAGKFIAAFAVERLVEFGRQAIETADQVGKMAQKVGISTESLSALSVQAGLSDVGIDALQGGLTKLAKNSAAAATGNKDLAGAFSKMGLDIKDASGHLKSTDVLLGEVAAKFASYEDSAEKTALAQKLFGKSGADLIPLLNELGERGFKAVREEAEKYGQVISGDGAKAAEIFNDNLTRLKMEAQGFAQAVVQQLLPGLNQLTTKMVEAGSTNDRYAESAGTVATAIKIIVAAVLIVKETLSATATVAFAFYDALRVTFESGGQLIAAWSIATGKQIKAAFTLDKTAYDAAGAEFVAKAQTISTKFNTAMAGVKAGLGGGLSDVLKNVDGTLTSLFGKFSNVAYGAETTAKAVKKGHAPLTEAADDGKKAAAANEAYAASLYSAAQAVVKLQGDMGPLSKAYADYVTAIAAANAKGEEIRTKGAAAGKALEAMAEAQTHVEQATKAASDALAKNIAKIEQSSDVVGRYIKKVQDDAALIGLTDRQKEITMALQDQQAAWEALSQEVRDHAIEIGQLDPTSEKGKAAIASVTGALYDQQKAFEANQAAAQQFQGIFTSAAQSIADAFGQLFTGQIKGFKDFGKQLLNIAKQMVSQLISQFIQLKVLGPIMSSIFGGANQSFGGSLASLAGSYFAGGGGGGGWDVGTIAQLAGYGGVGGGGSGIGGAAYNLFAGGNSAGGAYQAGQSLWGGFENAFSSSPNASSNLFGTYTPDYGAGTYAPSALGYTTAIAAGVYAGYNRYQQSNGGAAGIAGAAAYGYGTYAATIGTGAALSGGLAAGFAAIPVIGWIAIAAMLIDKFSGGKLFGTKGEVKSGVQTLSIGPGGADYSTFLALKGQKALFGGSKWSTQNVPQTPEEKAAAMEYFDNITASMKEYAEATGGKVGDLVAAAFGQMFDKHGNLTGITSATIAGHTYENVTAEQFSAGYLAANQLAALSQFDDALNASVEQYRANIDDMVAVANGLTTAQIALKAGAVFLGTGTDQTLSAILKLAEGAQGAGESIADTINRIIQAQAQYDQFVAQFKPAATFTSDFEAALASINAQLEANIAQANALAKAAGAEHAATQDLVNIHKYAAAQFAAAVSQLKANANSLAAQLGYALPQSLDEINSQIAELEGAAQGAGDVRDFGSAMTDAANRAKAGIDLLLGNLSPLNDQAKLQVALQGLRAGTTTPEQVLEIGRRLYASTQAYKDLFAMVQQYGRGAGVGGGGGGGSSGLGGQTGGDSARLAELKQRRDELEAAKRHEDALDLAQKIADLASATGISIDEALAQVGIKDVAPFIKDLGLQSRADFDKLILQLEANTDSAGENVASLADKITTTNDLLNDILIAVGGHSSHPTPDASTDAPNNSAPGTPRGHGGHGRPMTPDEMRDAVAAGTQDGFIRGGGAIFPRSSRQ